MTAANGPELRAGLPVVVAGLGVSGSAAARALHSRGARVTVVDDATDERAQDRAETLRSEGVEVRTGDGRTLPEGTALVVVSPGWRPSAPLVLAAERAGVPVWGEVELAWRLRAGRPPAPWLVVTGTNGKTTTVRMLAAMLRAAGLDAVEAGNVGTPLVEVVTADPAPDAVVVELSSFQLHGTHSVRPHSAVVLNVAADHVDWHGSTDAYAAAKARVHRGVEATSVHNVDDALTGELAADSPARHVVGFTLGTPAPGQLGVVEDVLVDRAFVDDPQHAAELATFADVEPWAPHNVANALAAAALARSFGVAPEAVREGLRAHRPDPHRAAVVGSVGGVTYVDDSKATNPHAAEAAIRAFDRGTVVWVAGGLAKGASFDELVGRVAPRLRAAVLLGADRAVVAAALARHAPDVPVAEVDRTDTGAMDVVLAEAARLAQPGDTVLLAPACASMDMFDDYGARGDAFVAAVGRLGR